MASAPKKRKVDAENREFKPTWEFDFFFTLINQNPVCLICSKSVAVLKEYNLKRHYELEHAKEYGNLKGEQRLQKVSELKNGLKKQQSLFHRANTTSENAVKASFAVSEMIAKQMKSFSDGEFIKTCLTKVVEIMCPKEVNNISNVSLSRNTVTRRIESLGNDVVTSLKDLITEFEFYSMALDESLDVKDTAQLAIFVRGINKNFGITEELASLVPLKGTTTGADISTATRNTMDFLGLGFPRLSGIATDGAPSLVGKNNGAVAILNKDKLACCQESVIACHCIVHQGNLCAKTLNLPHVMSVVVSAVNFIKSRGLNHRQFQALLDELHSEHGDLLYYCEVRWLSRGAMLERFFELRAEIARFMTEKKKPIKELEDEEWTSDLAFMVDITKHLNELNLKLQGQNQHIGDLFSILKAFEAKLQLWTRQLSKGNMDFFPKLGTTHPRNTQIYVDKLVKLHGEFGNRFQDFRSHAKEINLFTSPFNVDVDDAPAQFQMELIDLQADDDLRNRFGQKKLIEFYRDHVTSDKFPTLRTHALKMFSLFGSTYICEQFFSRMKFTKRPDRSMMTDAHLEAQLRLATTNIECNMDRVLSSNTKQFQVSH